MTSLERYLLSLDGGVRAAISRMALGLAIPPVFSVISGGRDRAWISLILFAGLLLALRLIPAVLRRCLPFSREAKDIWAQRRNVARQHDSYQWQKLFWIGLGMLPYTAIGDGLGRGELWVMSTCLVGGCAGLLFWHGAGAGRRNEQFPWRAGCADDGESGSRIGGKRFT